MKLEILDYLKTQDTGVLAVEMLDGSPHGATLHFANGEDPFIFFFKTDREYRKAEPILKNAVTRASFVVGTNEADMKTFQVDGIIQVLQPDQKEAFDVIYFGKFPKKKEKAKNDNSVLFTFTPIWWRFTDWKTPQGKLVVTSE